MFTDEILELLDKFDNYPFFQNIIKYEYFQNLPKEKNNIVRSTLQKIIEKENKKLYTCQHNNCEKKAINSHEISEKSFLKKISKNNILWIINNNFKGNTFLFCFKDKSIGNISVFPGYCKEHDEILFRELDHFDNNYNDTFINKQALRSIKKEIFEHQKTIALAKDMIKNLSEIPEIEDMFIYQNMKDKLIIQEERLKRLNIIYNKIFSGITNKDYEINYKIFDIKNENYIFSLTIDLSKDDSNLAPIFIYKLIDKFIIAYLDNEDSINLVDEIFENEKIIYELIYTYKTKLIMNDDFIKNLEEETKRILLQNEELDKFGLNTYIMLKKELGLEKIFNNTLEDE